MMDDRRIEQTNGKTQFDPALLLTISSLLFVGILIIFVATIIGWQIQKSGEANTESWAAMTGLIGWATSQVSTIFANRYGTTQQSSVKDAVIAQQARTASAVAAVTTALVPPQPVAAETEGGGVTTSPSTTGAP